MALNKFVFLSYLILAVIAA